jgi:hypothetical protein
MKRVPKNEPKLTLKQEAFVLAYIETGNASEAYRRAYNAKGTSSEAVHVNACRLLKNPKVALRIAEFHERAEVETLLTLEGHMEELKTLREMAKGAGQFSAAISAEVKRGELRRFYVKQVESAHVSEFSRMSDEELDAFIWEGKQQLLMLKGGT